MLANVQPWLLLLTCNVDTIQCDDGIIKCEKTIWVPLNVKKIQSDVMLVLTNVTMEQSNMRKNKGTTV